MHDKNEKRLEALPPWLAASDKYIVPKDSDAFLNRSIDHFLGLIQKGRSLGGSRTQSQGHPLLALAHALLISFLVVLSREPSFLYFPLAWVLIQLCFLPSRDLVRILQVSLLAALFNVLVLLPAILLLGETRSSLIVLKVFITVTQMQIFASLTAWHDIIASLRYLRVPSIFILILHISLKYIYLLGETALALLYAFRLRAVGRTQGKGMTMGGIMGTLFIRSRMEAQALYQAMVCRAFDGTYYSGHRSWSLTWMDGLKAIIMVFLIYVFYMGGR